MRPLVSLGTFALLVIAVTTMRPAVNQAQESAQVALRPTAVSVAANFALSQPARDLPPEPTPAVGPDRDRGRVRIIPNREVPRDARPVDEDLLVQQIAPEPNMPGLMVSFEGMSNADNAAAFGFRLSPPDTNGDVGPAHYVQQINLLVRVYSKAGAPLTAPFKMSSLFAPLGGLCASNDNGDPVVLYDPLADRWILSQFGFASVSAAPYHECIAVSQTPDPAGAYFLYDFVTPGNNFPDYPKLGVWPDAYYMTTVQFLNGASFNGSGAFAFDRAKMLVGDPGASMIYFNLSLTSHPEGVAGLLPADLDGVSAPPPGAPNVMAYFTANEFGDPADAIRLFNFHADFAVPANSTFTERAGSPLPVAAFNPITPSGRRDIPQPAPATSTANLDAIGDRLLNRLQYRNFGGFESLVVNHTVDADSGVGYLAGVRYYDLRNPALGGTYGVNEQATFAPDGTHRWMGSAAMDHQGNLAVGYSVSSASVFPGIRYAGRLASDPPNGLFQGEGVLINGSGVQLSTSSRWGDYSALMVDPVDDCTFWYTTEYYTSASQATSTVGWLTRVGSFKFPSCTARPTGTLIVNVTACDSAAPVGQARVKLNTTFWSATNASGVFTARLDPGTYVVDVEKSGVGSGSTTVNVTSQGATTAVCLSSGGGDTDLTVSALKATGKAAAGSAVAVKYTIANSGGAASAPTTTKVYLSVDQIFNSGDTEIGSDATAAVPAGGSVSDSLNVTIPPGTVPGIYYLVARADAAQIQAETNEGNNTRAKKISIGPDLVISALSINPTSVAAGGSITISETTRNTGAQSTGGGSITRWYLSLDKKVGPGDNVLGSHAVPVLGPNATDSKSLAVTIPAGKAPGSYFVIAVADDGSVIQEIKETNAKSVKLTIF